MTCKGYCSCLMRNVNHAVTVMTNIKEQLHIKYQMTRKQSMSLSLVKTDMFERTINEMRDTENDIAIIDRALIVLNKHKQ